MVYSADSHDYLKVVCWIGWPLGAVSSLCVQSGVTNILVWSYRLLLWFASLCDLLFMQYDILDF